MLLLIWNKFFKIIATRIIFWYLAFLIVIWQLLNFSEAVKYAVGESMSRLTPSIDYFGDFVKPHEHLDEFKLYLCVNYHKRVIHFFPFEKAEAYQMMGFCYERLKDLPMAEKSYQTSMAVNSNYFWPYYNLGILSYKKGDYTKAVSYFQQGINKDEKINLMLWLKSKVFMDVRASNALNPDYDLLGSLREARKNAYILMMESLFKQAQYDQLLETAFLALKENFPNNDIFYCYAGKAAFYLKFYDKSFKLLELAVKNNPNNVDAIFYMGLNMRAANKEPLAVGFFNMAKRIYQQEGSSIEKHLNSPVQYF